MKVKCVPAMMTLSAGLVDCIISIYCHLDSFSFLKQLLVVLILFYLIGCMLQLILDIGMQKMEDKEDIVEEEKQKNRSVEDDKEEIEKDEVE